MFNEKKEKKQPTVALHEYKLQDPGSLLMTQLRRENAKSAR